MQPGTLTTALLLIALPAMLRAQPANDDCGSALNLCAQQPLTGNNTGAVGIPGFCPGTNSVLWYTFTTNTQGGAVEVALSGLDCPLVAGMDNELSVVVLAGDGSCQPGTFSAVSDCAQDSVDLSVTTDSLSPGTTYWVLVSGAADNGATISAQCDFSVAVSGPGADVVGVDFSAGPDVEIGEGELVQLEATGGTSYTWTPNAGLNADDIPDPVASPTETTTYTVSTTINGCTYTDDVLVEVIRRILPTNTFSPNGDGINDTWTIYGIADYPSCEVTIYDRWGQRIYRDVGYDEPWDGTNRGAKLPMATYYYHIVLNTRGGTSDAAYTGSITIVR